MVVVVVVMGDVGGAVPVPVPVLEVVPVVSELNVNCELYCGMIWVTGCTI